MLHRLKVQDSIYFNEVLKIKTLDINFESKKGLVLILGNNGYGKSSTLEFSLPYRRHPSREGAYNNHFINKCGSVSRIWTINDTKYEFRLTCSKTKTECFIAKQLPSGSWEQLLKTTKTDEYDKMVEKICGPESIFLKTVFKNRNTNFETMTEKELREFFLEVIGANKYRKYREILKSKRLLIQGEVKVYEKIISELNIPEDKTIDDLNLLFLTREVQLNNIILDLMDIEKSREICLKNIGRTNQIEENKQKYESQLKDLNEQLININTEITNKTNDTTLLQKDIDDLQTQLNEYLKLDIEEQETSENIITMKLAVDNKYKAEKDKKKLSIYKERLEQFASDIKFIQNSIDSYIKDELEVEDAKKTYEYENNNKCKVDPAICQNTRVIEQLKARYETLLDALNNKTHKDRLLSDIKNILDKANCEHISKLQDCIDKTVLDIKNIEQLISKYELETNNLETEQTKLLNIHKKRNIKNSLLLEMNSKSKEINVANNDIIKLTNDINRINEVLVELESALSNVNSNNSQADYDKLELEKKEKETIKTEITTELSVIKNDIDALNRNIEIMNDNKLKLDVLNNTLNKYKFIDDAFNDKDGIPMRKLKIIGPQIVQKANEILNKFNDIDKNIGYQIQFRNERLDSKGNTVDAFEIKIINIINGNEIILASLSMGQKIWIDIALSLGASAFMSANKFKTILLDEVDGSLSSENAKIFYNTLEEIVKNLKLSQIFIVTHRDDIIKNSNNFIRLEIDKEKY